MWIERLTNSRTLHALELTAAFAEQRHRLLAENIANIDTPDYQTRQLDPKAFQAALRVALDRARADGRNRLELRDDAQVSTDPDGKLVTRPTTRPAENVLFHDGRNASLEKLMTDVQSNALDYQLASRLLSKRFEELLAAIRGRMA